MVGVIIVLLFIAIFHHNPSFSVLGPNIIAGHETGPKQVALNGSRASVILLIPTFNTWTKHEAFPMLVPLRRIAK
jgi:hypothetical protein